MQPEDGNICPVCLYNFDKEKVSFSTDNNKTHSSTFLQKPQQKDSGFSTSTPKVTTHLLTTPMNTTNRRYATNSINGNHSMSPRVPLIGTVIFIILICIGVLFISLNSPDSSDTGYSHTDYKENEETVTTADNDDKGICVSQMGEEITSYNGISTIYTAIESQKDGYEGVKAHDGYIIVIIKCSITNNTDSTGYVPYTTLLSDDNYYYQPLNEWQEKHKNSYGRVNSGKTIELTIPFEISEKAENVHIIQCEKGKHEPSKFIISIDKEINK